MYYIYRKCMADFMYLIQWNYRG